MKIVINWVRDFVDVTASDEELRERLTLAGLAIDGVENGVLEADIGTNRPDAMNHYGIARELSCLYDLDLKPIRPSFKEAAQAASEVASVEIADPDLCARFSARLIMGVKIGPSPEWLVKRLAEIGQRSINNVADITNYLMWENGQPLHAYDLDTLAGRKIIVRRARPGETMQTLDGVDRTFTTDHLVIADAEKAVGIGGIMGGENTGISARTVNVLLEAAWFEPKAIRKTARYFGMHTDASHRFERGMDVAFTATATDRAAELIQQLAGGEILRGHLDVKPNVQPRAAIELRRKELDRIIGVQIPAAEVLRIARRLGFRPEELGYGNWKLIPPTWRLDVAREIDVIEEIARQYGFERLPDHLCGWAGEIHRTPNAVMERALRDTARALGYDETIAISLVPEARTRRYSQDEPLKLANPLSAESAVLRTSPLPGVLDAVLWNLNHGESSSHVFEVGKIYRDGSEPATLGIAAAGRTFPELKGDIETILELFAGTVAFEAETSASYLHPGRAARVLLDGQIIGRFGELHPRAAADHGFRQPVLAAELLLDPLYAKGPRPMRHQELPRFPAVDRDFSLLVPDGVTFAALKSAITALSIEDLRDVTVVGEQYRKDIATGYYGLLLRVRFHNYDRTLADAEVNEHAARIVEALKQLQATLRSAREFREG